MLKSQFMSFSQDPSEYNLGFGLLVNAAYIDRLEFPSPANIKAKEPINFIGKETDVFQIQILLDVPRLTLPTALENRLIAQFRYDYARDTSKSDSSDIFISEGDPIEGNASVNFKEVAFVLKYSSNEPKYPVIVYPDGQVRYFATAFETLKDRLIGIQPS